MNVVDSTVETVFFVPESGENVESLLERIGRISHKSEDKISEGTAEIFINQLLSFNPPHLAALEFGYFIAFIVADRGLSHELVRHRLASFLQESTRLCNYYKGKFGNQITVINQPGLKEENRQYWLEGMASAESYYLGLIERGEKPDVARSLLPIGVKTEIVIGTNVREWMHVFNMRCSKKAHPIIRGITRDILTEAVKRYPTLYADQYYRFIEQEAA